MPTYEYECPKCGHTFEKFQGINDPPARACPRCRGRKVKRLIGTGAGILFKGSGFYSTDYRSNDYRQAAKSEKTASGGSSGAATSETAGKAEPAAKPAKPKEPGGKPKAARGKTEGR